MLRRRRRILFWGLFIALLLIAAAIYLGPAHGHEASSGWQYPADCCGGQDCKQVACEAIEEQDGVYKWRGTFFNKNITKPSGDGKCHVCIEPNVNGAQIRWGRCLFLDFGT